MRRSLIAFAAAILVAEPARAHDIWITLSSGAVVPQIPALRSSGRSPETAGRQAGRNDDERRKRHARARPEIRGECLGVDPDQRAGSGSRRAVVAARYDNGFWVKAPDGSYRNTTKRFLSGATEAITSVEFAKFVAGTGAPYAEPVGHELEIVPLDDPSAVRPGDALRVKVLFRGVAVAGAKVARSDGEAVPQDKLPIFTTDASGIASIPIERSGGEVLSVSRRVTPSSVPDLVEANTFSATLAYAVEQSRTN